MLSLWDRLQISIAVYQGQRDFERELKRTQKLKNKMNLDVKAEDNFCVGKAQQNEVPVQSIEPQQGPETAVKKNDPNVDREKSPFERWCEQELPNRLKMRNEAKERVQDAFDFSDYDCYGYNSQGLDRSGRSREDYRDEYMHLCKKLEMAEDRMKAKEYGDALHRVALIFDKALEMLIVHSGRYEGRKTLDEKLTLCKERGILDENSEFVSKLYEMKRIRNKSVHEIDFEDCIDHNKVYFMVATAGDLVKLVQLQLSL